MFENKEVLRKKFSKLRKELVFRDEKNCKITEKVLQLLSEKQFSSIFTYVSFGSEVKTIEIIKNLFPRKKIFVPYTYLGEMKAARLIDLDKLKKVDKFGNVYEQNEEENLEFDQAPDVTIVPMLAFSNRLFRVGYGGGYYDKFLAKARTFKIGLAFDEQLVEDFNEEAHDEQLDCVITPTKIYRR
jgi:5-formyltetrahydrofolate cyclo-ligase